MRLSVWRPVASLFAMLLLVLGTSMFPAAPAAGAAIERYIVVFDAGVNPEIALPFLHRLGVKVGYVYRHALSGASVEAPAELVREIAALPYVAWFEQDRLVTVAAQVIPSGVDRTDVETDPAAAVDGADQVLDVDVAVLDTGIDASHPDLRVHRSVDCLSNSCAQVSGSDSNGHGTHVGGVVAAKDNDIGVTGVAPGARLWGVRVLDSQGGGYVSSLVAGVDYVAAHAQEIEVANLSLGARGHSPALRTAIRASVEKGVVFVAAAGNNGEDVFGPDGRFATSDDTEPGAYPEVAAIAAFVDTDGRPGGSGPLARFGSSDRNGDGVPDGRDDSFAFFSNYSRSTASGNPVSSPGAAIDLVLPGVDILSTWPGGGYQALSGTSFASPHAAGLAALHILSNGRARSASGVYAIRQALIDRGTAQTGPGGLAIQNDPDANKERLGRANAASVSPPVPSPAPPAPPPSTPTPPPPSGTSPNPPSSSTNAAPQVSIISPARGQQVSGTYRIRVSASDDRRVAKVEISAGGSYVNIAGRKESSNVYYYDWVTTRVPNGRHTIKVVVKDSEGAKARASVTVTVANRASSRATVRSVAEGRPEARAILPSAIIGRPMPEIGAIP